MGGGYTEGQTSAILGNIFNPRISCINVVCRYLTYSSKSFYLSENNLLKSRVCKEKLQSIAENKSPYRLQREKSFKIEENIDYKDTKNIAREKLKKN